MSTHYTRALELAHLNGVQPSLMLLVAPVFFLHWQVQMSAMQRGLSILLSVMPAVKKVYSTSALWFHSSPHFTPHWCAPPAVALQPSKGLGTTAGAMQHMCCQTFIHDYFEQAVLWIVYFTCPEEAVFMCESSLEVGTAYVKKKWEHFFLKAVIARMYSRHSVFVWRHE